MYKAAFFYLYAQPHEQVSSSPRGIQDMSLLIYPALARLSPSMQHDRIALHPAREVVPRHRHHGVLALEVGVLLFKSSLHGIGVSIGTTQRTSSEPVIYILRICILWLDSIPITPKTPLLTNKGKPVKRT